MRFSILILILSAVAACSSAKKQPPTPVVPAAPAPAQTPAPATAASPSAKAKLSCTHGSDARILELRQMNKGCELGYTKAGKEAVVATSVNGLGHCEKTLEKIKEKLVASGFTCQ